MTSLLAFVLAAMRILAPDRDHAELGAAIAEVVEAEAPLFAEDADRTKTAALVVAVAFREGSLRLRVEGDLRGGKPTSFCTMQIHRSSGGSTELNDDPSACIRAGLAMLRTSSRVCRAHPVAWYAEGPKGCTSPRAQRISRDRLWLARRVLAEVTAGGAS
jgi:hypothetical protein